MSDKLNELKESGEKKLRAFKQRRAEKAAFEREKKTAANEEYEQTYREESRELAINNARERAIKKAHEPSAIGKISNLLQGGKSLVTSPEHEKMFQRPALNVRPEPARSSFREKKDRFLTSPVDHQEGGSNINAALADTRGGSVFGGLGESRGKSQIEMMMDGGKEKKSKSSLGGSAFSNLLSGNSSKKSGSSFGGNLLSSNSKKGGFSLNFFDGTRKAKKRRKR